MEGREVLGRLTTQDTEVPAYQLTFGQALLHDPWNLVFLAFAIAPTLALMTLRDSLPAVVVCAAILIALTTLIARRVRVLQRVSRDGVRMFARVVRRSSDKEEAAFMGLLTSGPAPFFRRRAWLEYTLDGRRHELEVRVRREAWAPLFEVGEEVLIVVDREDPRRVIVPLLYVG